jgi:hypothetical protein
MRTGVFFLALGFTVMASQAGLASDFTDTSANHVTIVVNQGHANLAAAKKVKKAKIKKVAARPVTKKVVAAAKPVTPVKKTQVVASKAIVPVQTQDPLRTIPGRRAALANRENNHANGYSSLDTSNMYYPRGQKYAATPTEPLGIGADGLSSAAPTLTTKVLKRQQSEPSSYWEFQYKSDNAVNMNALENYGTNLDYTIAAWDRLYLTYYMTKDISLGVIGQYYHTWFQDQNRPQSSSNPGLGQTYASYLGDTGIVFNDKKIATLAGGIDFSGTMSYYAPTSQSSQSAGLWGQTRTGLALGKSIGQVDLKWNEILWYDWQQYETNANLSSKGTPLLNPQYYILSNIDFTYNFTKKFSFALESGFINEQNYGDSYNGIGGSNNDYLEVNPELDYSFTKNLGLSLGIWEVYNMTIQPTDNGQTVSFYTPFAPYNGTAPGSWTASQLYLMGTVTF